MGDLTNAETAKQAIDNLFNDVSVPLEETREALLTLREQILDMLSSMD